MSTSDIEPRDAHQPDPAFDRLRASDPAATTEPDTTVIRAKVDTTSTADSQVTEALSAELASTEPASAASAAAVVDLATQRRTRRPARWLQIAAAAAGVVAVGGGAFFAGQQSSGTPISAETAAARTGATTSPAAPAADAPVAASGATGTGFASGAQPESARSASAMDMVGNIYGRTVFTSSGLSAATSSAQAWGYDPAATFSAETAARLAAAIGVSGDPILNYGSWHVGSVDWTAAALDLSSDAQTSFNFSDPAFQPWAENSTSTGVPAEDAVAVVTDMMVEFGVDPATYTITSDSQDPKSTTVIATPVLAVGGNGTWFASVTTDGLVSLNGTLAPLVDLGTYDVVSPQTAVDRLSDERFGATRSYSGDGLVDPGFARGTVMAVPEMAVPDLAILPDDPAAVPTLPGTPAPGASIAWPVTNVTITGATLGTNSYYQPDGSMALLPTYTLTGSDGSAWTVLAVADAHLDFAATS